MCILFAYVDPAPPKGGYRLVIAANRDEYYSRPASAAEFDEARAVIGGTDLHPERRGGMWLGVSPRCVNGCRLRFAALLNVTGEDKQSGARGRGALVTDYLSGGDLLPQYVTKLEEASANFNSYNLVSVECSDADAKAYHYSNTPSSLYTFKGKQTLSFGNSTPEVPLLKVQNGRRVFQSIVNECNDQNCRERLVNQLLNLLRSREKHLPDPELKRRAPEAYEGLSSIFVDIEPAGYGTRTHSIVLVDADWNLEFVETTLKEPIDIKHPEWTTKTIKSRL